MRIYQPQNTLPEPFRHCSFEVERKNDGGFRIYGLTSAPYLSITREQAEAWLSWMEKGGVQKLQRLLEKKG
jgi:hypothetical protein